MESDESPEAWMAKTRRRNAFRLFVVGFALLVAGGVWAATYWNDGVGVSPISYVRVISVLVITIGAAMAIAGTALLVRRRR